MGKLILIIIGAALLSSGKKTWYAECVAIINPNCPYKMIGGVSKITKDQIEAERQKGFGCKNKPMK